MEKHVVGCGGNKRVNDLLFFAEWRGFWFDEHYCGEEIDCGIGGDEF